MTNPPTDLKQCVGCGQFPPYTGTLTPPPHVCQHGQPCTGTPAKCPECAAKVWPTQRRGR